MDCEQKDYLAVDDSGDVGLREGSSSYFSLAAVVFSDSLEAERASLGLRKLKQSLNWRDDHEFKFNKMRRDLIVRLIGDMASFDFKIYALYIDKKHASPERMSKGWDKLYNRVILELLSRIPLHDAVVRIDGMYGKKYMRTMESQLRKDLNKTGRRVDNIKFVDSKVNMLVQLADIAVGSVNRSLQGEKTDSQDYIGLLKDKVILFEELVIG